MPEHPCAKGLTPSCFKAYPVWARQALAYKLLHAILPKQLTKGLPKGLNLPMIGPGSILPPGIELPPGTVIAPDVTFPPGWSPGDPAPPGVVIPPGTTFPPGWTPGDPAPPGVIIPPGTIFPPGWTPGDPAPPGVFLPPSVSPFPPPVEGSGVTPPLYMSPFEPGPVHRPSVPVVALNTRNPESDYSVTWNPSEAYINYAMVDDYPDIDDSNYNWAYTDYSIDEFNTTPFSVPLGATITSLSLYIRGHAMPDEWGSMSAFIVIDDIQYFATADEWFSTEWVEKVFSWTLDPSQGMPWTAWGVNNVVRFGYMSEATMVSGVFVSRAYLKVN